MVRRSAGLNCVTPSTRHHSTASLSILSASRVSPLFISYYLILLTSCPVSEMAEVLAIAGGISAFAEISSYLMKGCLSFQELVKDAKNAPADVRSLIEELASTEQTAKGIEQIIRDMADQELRTKVYEAVRLPFERCVKVVIKLKSVLLK